MKLTNIMNRIHNANNPHQGKEKKVLCVCSAGLLRSPTAAFVLAQKYGYNTRSVGCNEDYALQPADQVILSWADEIVVMEENHVSHLEKVWPEIRKVKNIFVLGIPDRYARGDPELVSLIEKNYEDALFLFQKMYS